MQEIKCPNCGEVFQVDESGYAQIVSQVRDKEFAKEIERRQKELEAKKDKDLEVIKLQQESAKKKELDEFQKLLMDKDAQIAKLMSQVEHSETDMKLAVSEALKKVDAQLADKDKEISSLNQKIVLEQSKRTEEVANTVNKMSQQINEKDLMINELKGKLANGEIDKKLAVNEAVQVKEKELNVKQNEINDLNKEMDIQKAERSLSEKNLKESYEIQLKMKDETIEQYKDFKARQSTKMIGESLEQHCSTQFNQIRMTAFPNAYFEKDNDAKGGSKGDFIFREKSEDGTEFISIMFEMKNEMDTTATKHKNEDFFDKLDKDRKEKKCEYAVLVSLLEADNELYNNGIVDVSYKYEKMYVIRPQFFIPMITLLRNAALNSLKYQKELAIVRSQQVDVMNFENNMMAFKDAFGKNYAQAAKKYDEAISEIDKTIQHLQKVRDALTSSGNQLRLANNKVEDLSIKKLTKNAPSVRAMFEENKK